MEVDRLNRTAFSAVPLSSPCAAIAVPLTLTSKPRHQPIMLPLLRSFGSGGYPALGDQHIDTSDGRADLLEYGCHGPLVCNVSGEHMHAHGSGLLDRGFGFLKAGGGAAAYNNVASASTGKRHGNRSTATV